MVGILLLGFVVPDAVVAQVAPKERHPDASQDYDLNNDGRIDAKDDVVTTGEGSKGPANSGSDSDTVVLSPFEVTESNNGYYATNTMSGTRLNTKLEDLGSSISVVTKQQMADFAMLDINDIFAYEAGAEGADTYTEFSINRKGQVSDQVMNDRESVNRLRGIGAANITRAGFATSGRVPIDPIDIEAVEISRGPNSSIFGLGEGSGTVNMVAASAYLNRSKTTTQVRFDDVGGWRTSLDISRPLIHRKLAVRVSGVYQHDEYQQKPSGYDTRRVNAMVRAQPFSKTSIRASFQSYRASGNRATTMMPRDGVSYWRQLGEPTWDPITQTVTTNDGVSKKMTGTQNPAGLSNMGRPGPIQYVDSNGIQLWEISRMPAANATNGPSNTSGTNRLLETIPDPIRDGRPLFAIIPSITDSSIYDYAHINLAASNFARERVETTMAQLEQFVFDTGRNTLAIQLAWQGEKSKRFRHNTIGSSNPVGTTSYIYIDANERLLDGRPNPFFKRPYISVGAPVYTRTPYKRETYRAQLAYVLDLSKEKSKWLRLLGRQQFLGYYEERRIEQSVYRFRDVMISDHPVYAPAGQPKGNQNATAGYPVSQVATRPYFHYYLGDADGQNVDHGAGLAGPGVYPFTWYDPKAKTWVTDSATFGEAGITEASAGNNGNSTLNLVQTTGAILQSTFFNNRLVTTFGRRHDKTSYKGQRDAALLPNGYDFDYEAMEGWVGDWDTKDGDTSTAGVVVRPLRDLGFIESARRGSGWVSAMANVLQGLGLYYNRSDSFLPDAPAINLFQEVLPNPSGKGKDYGITISLGSKFMIRANHYETLRINSRQGQGTTMANRLKQTDFVGMGSTRAFILQDQARNWVSQGNPALSAEQVEAEVYRIIGLGPEVESAWRSDRVADIADIEAKGEEYELNYNPTNFWTLRANLTRTESKNVAQSLYNVNWLKKRYAHWETIVDPRTGTKWLDTGYVGDFPSPGAATARDYIESNIVTPLRIYSATEGTSRPQIREWRFNLATRYQLAGLTDHRILRNLTVGGGVRWESKGAIGFYGVPIDGDIEKAETLDPTRPIWDKAHAYFDAFVAYQTDLFNDKVRARFQLNVRNLQESHARLQPVDAYPNGVPHSFRIVNPRTFILSASFDL